MTSAQASFLRRIRVWDRVKVRVGFWVLVRKLGLPVMVEVWM